MIGFPIGIVYSNAVEWVLHKYLLHGLGKRKNSFFSFHWSNHHRNARRFGMYDPDYKKPIWNWESRGREVAAIAVVVAVHIPIVAVAPWFAAAVVYSGANYLYKHKKSHTDVEWGKRHMPHHYDHHMGKDQDANWCVTRPWTDWVLGTRLKFDYPAEVPGIGEAQPAPNLPEQFAANAEQPLTVGASTESAEQDTPQPIAAAERSDVFNTLDPSDWRPGDEDVNLVPSKPPKAA